MREWESWEKCVVHDRMGFAAKLKFHCFRFHHPAKFPLSFSFLGKKKKKNSWNNRIIATRILELNTIGEKVNYF